MLKPDLLLHAHHRSKRNQVRNIRKGFDAQSAVLTDIAFHTQSKSKYPDYIYPCVHAEVKENSPVHV